MFTYFSEVKLWVVYAETIFILAIRPQDFAACQDHAVPSDRKEYRDLAVSTDFAVRKACRDLSVRRDLPAQRDRKDRKA